MNNLSKSNINDKLICEHIEEVVQTYEKLKVPTNFRHFIIQ